MKYLAAFISTLFLVFGQSIAQPNANEAFKKVLQSSSNDSLLVDAITKLSMDASIKPREMLYLTRFAKEQGERTNSKTLLENTYHQMALAYNNLRIYDSAIGFFRKAQEANNTTKDLALKGLILHDVGYCFYQQNILDSALVYYHRALETKKLIGKPKPIAATLNGIGLVYRTRNSYETATGYYRQAIDIYEKLNDPAALRVMGNVATLYNLQKKYDSATSIFKQIYSKAAANKDANTMLFAQVNIALALNYQEKYGEALPVFEELIRNPRVKQSEDIDNAVQYGLGQSYMGVKDYPKAIPILKNCLNLKFRNTKYQSLAAITNLLYTAEKQQGNFKQALDYYEQVKVYSDSLVNKDRTALIEELDKKYKTAEKEQQLLLLDKDNKLKDLSLQKEHQSLLLSEANNKQKLQDIDLLNKQNEVTSLLLKQHEQSLLLSKAQNEKANQQLALLNKENQLQELSIKEKKRANWLFALGLVLVTIVAASVFILYRNKQKTSKQLEEKNAIISKSLEEKEVLLKEIHHRVKNNLQVVSSLLNIQSRSINDSKALAAIKEGRDRVKSMALIHQNLYSDDNLMGVDVKDYIEKLTQSLFASYNIQNEKVQLQTDIDELNLDVDTVVPIGLILTELISNALKYAFDETQPDGSLQVKLKQENGNLLLRVKDNGKGLPANWSHENTSSMGYQLIRSFATKMKAMLTITGNNGTDVQMVITKYKLANE